MHLSNATESDHAWLYILSDPEAFWIFQNGNKGKLESFLYQLDPQLSILECCERLFLGHDLRFVLCKHLKKNSQSTFRTVFMERKDFLEAVSIARWKRNENKSIYEFHKHPILEEYRSLARYSPWIQEVFFLILSFDYLERHPYDEFFARAFHVYLLLQGFFQTLMVQQKMDVGFDQFGKIVRLEVRDISETSYLERFYQLNGNDKERLAFLEGRFNPKCSLQAQAIQLRRILGDYYIFFHKRTDTFFKLGSLDSWRGKKCRMDLRLVAHFIKEEDKDFYKPNSPRNSMGLLVRHHQLRNKLRQQAETLIQTRSIYPEGRLFITGIDAANNELFAGPEVFAPVFRYCRRHGMTHFTYHAGEDFHHLLGGLRTIYEAMTFLNMHAGDRIGHATAAGIEPELWINNTGECISMAEGEWLDDLVFAASLLRTSHDAAAGSLLSRIHVVIEEMASRIYGSISMNNHGDLCPNQAVLEDAWKMRRLDALLLQEEEGRQWDLLFTEDRKEYQLISEEKKMHPVAFNLLRRYHDTLIGDTYFKQVTIPLYEENNQSGRVYPLFSPNDLRRIQNLVLEELHRREIVLEAPLISNVRISYYQSPKEHHLWRWLHLNKEASDVNVKMPAVCLGSDDPGIFNTNIYNEYAHVFMVLTREWGKSPNEAVAYMNQLLQNSFAYRFDSDSG